MAQKYTVRLTGTSPVWTEIEVEAKSAAEAKEIVEKQGPAMTANWEVSEGGNGVNDWDFDSVMDADGNEIQEVDASLLQKLVERAEAAKLTAAQIAEYTSIPADRLNNGGVSEIITLLLEEEDPAWVEEAIDELVEEPEADDEIDHEPEEA